jgi:RsiW-degrading membrane proteinase PrsW (M82 family)
MLLYEKYICTDISNNWPLPWLFMILVKQCMLHWALLMASLSTGKRPKNNNSGVDFSVNEEKDPKLD